jgi:hypothetical protein
MQFRGSFATKWASKLHAPASATREFCDSNKVL